MDYEDPGTPKPGAAVLANMITPEGRKLPLLITENFGRGRTAIMATGGSWRWQMSSPLGDTAHDLFWQQLLRWVASDTPGHVAASVPAQMLLDNGAVTITADVRDPQYNPAADAKVEAHILGPSGVSALVEMTPVPDNPGQFQAAWSAPKTGAYLTEVTAQRADAASGPSKNWAATSSLFSAWTASRRISTPNKIASCWNASPPKPADNIGSPPTSANSPAAFPFRKPA